MSSWFIDEENSVSYRLLGDARPASGDWVGLFHNEFSSLDEYIVYEYVGRGERDTILLYFFKYINFHFAYIYHSYFGKSIIKTYGR